MHFFRDSGVSPVLESSCITHTLRFCARRFLALAKKSLFLEVPYKKIASVFLLLAALSGCSGDNFPALQVGVQAPAYTTTLLDGKTISVSDYKGKGLLMIFMSSWCPCSNESIPIVNAAYQRHQGDNIEFLIIGIQEARSKFERFVKKQGIAFPATYDGDKLISPSYGINAPPTMVFIDKKGMVKRVFFGNIKDKKKEFVQWLEEII